MDFSFKSTESASILDAACALMTTFDDQTFNQTMKGKPKPKFRSKIPRWVGKSTKKRQNSRQKINQMAKLFNGDQEVKRFLYDLTRLNFRTIDVLATKRIRARKIVICLQN